MKNLKKLGALLLALTLILSLGATAFAEDIGDTGIKETSATSIVIKKEITAFNPAGSTVNAPSITYTYAIAPGSAGKVITDSEDISATTVAGPAGATITSPTITWDAETPADRMTTSSGGTANTKEITVDFSTVPFPAAGVYRYVITETADYANTGVVDGGDHTRYLDVYVKNSATEGQYEIYGYVCFKHDNNIDGSADAAEADQVAKAVKTEGFVANNDEQDALTTDKYYTYNLTVSKTLSGDAGMNNHQFPFGIAFSGSETGVLPIISGNAGTKPTWETKGAMSSFDTTVDGATLKIANGQSVTITGIPIGTSVTINEKNDVTGTTYKSSSSGADTDADEKMIATGVASNNAVVDAQTTDSTIADKTVAFTNVLMLISPTGVVLRVAPYILMLAGGFVLLALSRKRKSREEA